MKSNQSKLSINLYDHAVEEGRNGQNYNVVYYAYTINNHGLECEEVTSYVAIPACDWKKVGKSNNISYENLKQIFMRIKKLRHFLDAACVRNSNKAKDILSIKSDIFNVMPKTKAQLSGDLFGSAIDVM